MTKSDIPSESEHYFDRAYLRREVFTQDGKGDGGILTKLEVSKWLGIDQDNTILDELFEDGDYSSATLFVRAVEEKLDVLGDSIDRGDNLLSLDELSVVFGYDIDPETNAGTEKPKNKRK